MASRARIVVVGVGGAGVNAVCRLADVGLPGVRLVAVDTSAQTLARATQAERILLATGTRGLGTGGDPSLGAAAATASTRSLRGALDGGDLVFVVAGLAGGTGGGAGPEVARLARAADAVTVGFGVLPFAFEPQRRREAAATARHALRGACDTLVLLDNARAARLAGAAVPLDVALRIADDVLRQAVQGVTELLAGRGIIDVDLAHVRAVLTDAGYGCLSLGMGRGDAPARAATAAALANPLADMGVLGRVRAALVQVTGGADLAVSDVAAAVDLLRARLSPSCDLVVGVGHDRSLDGAAQVTLLGTGVTETVAVRMPERPFAAHERPARAASLRHEPRPAEGRPSAALGVPVRQAV